MIRVAKHAGSWYDNRAERLNNELNEFMQAAEVTLPANGGKLKAIIGPHAGLAYSGPTAAWAYKNLAQ